MCVYGEGGGAVTEWVCPVEVGNITGDQNCTVVVVSIGYLMVVVVSASVYACERLCLLACLLACVCVCVQTCQINVSIWNTYFPLW